MSRSHRRRDRYRLGQQTALRGSAFRALFSERLENRLLLTAVTSVDPPENSFDAAASTNISATFDVAINAATATPDTFVVSTRGNGRLSSTTASISTAGQTVTLDPSANLFPGEIVRVTATSGIQSTAGAANEPHVWEFRTEVNSGSAQFTDSGQVLGANQDGEVRFGDLDGDGDLDVVQGGSVVFLNDGNGIFTNTGQALGAGNWDLADIDGDGDLDVVGENNVFTNDGTGLFTGTGQDLSPGVQSDALEVGDIDGDGDMDVMVGVQYGGNLVWRNDGNGNFANTGQSLGNSTSFDIVFGDFDKDGDLDAFTANQGPANRVWINDGTGVFSDSTQALGGFRGSSGLHAGDVDGDGDLDVLVANGGGVGTHVWINDGNAVFTDTGQVLNGNGGTNWGVRLGDLDGDGDLDTFVPGWNRDSQIFLNNGSGQFSLSQSLNFAGLRRAGWVDFGDVDGDGDLDAFEGNRFGDGARLWINQNLQPSVSLSIDNATIAEDAGAATVTATLSAVHTLPVTVDLGLSGTATEGVDYATSGTQIVIAAGAASGSVAITAIQDTDDDDDETVVVDITGTTNADEAGTQQVMTTILDDDEAAPVPDVTLSVDNAAIVEAGGVATFTATLSLATTAPVTVDLGLSGSAAASDYTASGTQIVIAAGATTGAVTVTAVQDTVDESDETVIIDITNVSGGNESGIQQQTTTITDDDEPVVPDVTLSVDNASIAEEAGVATFVATLSEGTSVPVTVELDITGSATAGDDYTASGSQIVIAPGATTGSVTVTAVQDTQDEPDESVVVDIAAVANGNESGTQQATTTIEDDDEPQGFVATSVTMTGTGFQAEFTNDIDIADLNLYDTQTGGLGPADVVLTGAASGPVSGSLVVAGRGVEFIKSGDPLAPDTYTVTLRSAPDGFKDSTGVLLDGDGDGTAGDDFTSTFTVAEPAANAVTVGIPDVVRGPGQEINVPADTAAGIPLTISDGANVRAIDVRIGFDPALMNIAGATVGPDAPAGASVIVNTSTPGLAIVVYFSTAPLPAGVGTFVNLQASVPTEGASENYRRQQVLDVHGVIVSDGNDNESPVIEDDALHVATFFADVSANGRINAADAAQVARIAALIDGGFGSTASTDPNLLGDISGNGRLNAADASLVAQFAAIIAVPQIPTIPAGVLVGGLSVVQEPSEATDDGDHRLEIPISLEFEDDSDLGQADWTNERPVATRDASSEDAVFGELLDDVLDVLS
jgi:hypothetical protein